MPALRPINEVAERLGLRVENVIPWGRHRAKVELAALDGRPARGRLVLVSAITPTPPGEGKTTTSVALAMGLCRRGRNAVAALREPSLGPVFGVKGGGTGGGLATLEPAQDINLHFTGDIHAVGAANNLLAALVDNDLHFRSPVELDPRSVRWRRCLDMNDRSLREIVTGLGGRGNGVVRETGFDITAASEMMAILALSEGPKDLEARCARIVVGQSLTGEAVTAGQLKAASAMAALLQDALLPNLVQTREGGPAIVHAGPFGNIAHGCSSVLGTRLGLAYADEVITEAGFGFELGAEKFLDIKCRSAGLWPRGVTLVATLRALKFHGGAPLARVAEPDADALERGLEHLWKHLETVAAFGLPAVVAVNRFPQDSEAELQTLKRWGRSAGVPVAVCEGFAKGGEGALELADAVLAMLDRTESSPLPHSFSTPSTRLWLRRCALWHAPPTVPGTWLLRPPQSETSVWWRSSGAPSCRCASRKRTSHSRMTQPATAVHEISSSPCASCACLLALASSLPSPGKFSPYLDFPKSPPPHASSSIPMGASRDSCKGNSAPSLARPA